MNLIHADLLKWLGERQWLAQNDHHAKYHAVLSDPPYFLGSIVERFGKADSAPAQYGKDGAFSRASRGFMGATWDGFESPWHFQAWVTEWASMLLDFMHPGALGLFFGGTRTYHRLAAGLEDAGWVIADEIDWIYGSGFPKSHNVDDGHGTALKPAHEPIVVARAPRGKYTYEELFKQFGTGVFNIDGARIGTDTVKTQGGQKFPMLYGTFAEAEESFHVGRWPANVIMGTEVERVLHLRYNIPEDVKRVIREYFNGYSVVQAVRQGVRSSSSVGSSGSAEILQQGMLRGMAERQHAGRQTPDEGQEAYARSLVQDAGDQAGTCQDHSGRESSDMEGGQALLAGLPDDQHGDAASRGTGSVCVDGKSLTPHLNTGASAGHGAIPESPVAAERGSASSERHQVGQPSGELGTPRQCDPQADASGNCEGFASATRRERAIEVVELELAESLIPPQWLQYFEDTGKRIEHSAGAMLDLMSGESTSTGGQFSGRKETHENVGKFGLDR